MQEAIGRPILLENPSTYVVFPESTMSETDFIRALVQRTGCGLLLDVNNVFVSATNHGYSALDYLADFPLEHVGEIHLAGHAEQADDEGDLLLIDSHDGPVADAVWKLFEIVIGRCGPIPTLVEWDSKIPEWPMLKAEAAAAQAILDRHAGRSQPEASPCCPLTCAQARSGGQLRYAAGFVGALLDPDVPTPDAVAGPNGKAADQALQRLPQQRHRQPDRCAGGDVPGDAAHHRRGLLPRDGAVPCPRHAADLAAPVRVWPRLSRFHRSYEYARSMPWLADVARIERAWLDAYHAADAEPLAPAGPGVDPARAAGAMSF